MKMNFSVLGILMSMFLLFSSCSDDNGDDPNGNKVEKSAIVQNYTDIILASYNDALEDAKDLRGVIETFVAEPS